MSGVAFPNKPQFFQAPSGQRATVAGADFILGGNRAGSNACGIGICTGVAGVKSDDWSDDERLIIESQAIGQLGTDINLYDIITPDNNNELSYVQADGDIAVNAEIKAGTGALNRTGAVIPTGTWAWGEVLV